MSKARALLDAAPVRRETVTVRGVDLELVEPSRDQAVAVRNRLLELREGSPGSMLLETRAECVRNCLPDDALTQDEAVRLLLMAGGEQGKLAKAAWELHGLSGLGAAAKADSDPT